MALIAPLDLQTLLVSVFSGTSMIFILVFILMIVLGASKFRMTPIVVGVIVLLFSILILPISSWPYIFILVIVGLLVGYTMTRFQR